MKLSINTGGLSPALRKLASSLGGPGRAALHEAMGREVQKTTEAYLRDLAATRHGTASRLGAAPSGYLSQAATKAADPAALTANTDGATYTITHPALNRAFSEVTITPKNAKSLAIPIHALAYNRRPSELASGGHQLFIKRGRNILATRQGDSTLALYLLVRSVTQSQDRTLLPSDQDWASAAARGAAAFLHQAATTSAAN